VTYVPSPALLYGMPKSLGSRTPSPALLYGMHTPRISAELQATGASPPPLWGRDRVGGLSDLSVRRLEKRSPSRFGVTPLLVPPPQGGRRRTRRRLPRLGELCAGGRALLGKVARRAGWGVGCCIAIDGLHDRLSLAAPSDSCFPHPIRRCAPPSPTFVGEGVNARPGGPRTHRTTSTEHCAWRTMVLAFEPSR